MKNLNKKTMLNALAISLILCFAGPVAALAATSPSLGAAKTYGVLSSTYTDTSGATTVNGDVGFTTPPATAPAGVHTNYGSGAPYAQAGIDQASALGILNAQPCDFTFGAATDLSLLAQPLVPGVYCITGAQSIGAGGITLTGAGTYIFRSTGALNTSANSAVTLSGGASACNIYWTPTATTLGANSTFAGTDIDNSGITVGSTVNWVGRALDFATTVTTDSDTITVPSCINIVKTVVNDNGGTATATTFNIHVKTAGLDVAGSPAAGAATPGTNYALNPGIYDVSEDVNTSYLATFSGDCDLLGNAVLALGDNNTCTITNDDIPPTINVVKTVVNDNGGTKTFINFPLFVNGVPVVSGISNVFAAGVYTVTETGDPQYTGAFSGDCDAAGHVTVIPGDTKFCILTNNDIAPVVVPPSGGGGGGGGGSSGGSGPSTILAPPIIDVVKVPSPLALPNGPGLVKYTYTLKNIGTVPVSNITMVGDSCSPITLISGDTNLDSKLGLNETWIYTCSTILPKTHTNTVVATGWANGISAADIASATVVVGAPITPPLIHVTKLPNPLLLKSPGGMVTYTEKVSNPGVVPLSNIQLKDDKCSPLNYISGDINVDLKLDPSEIWTFTCSTNLTQTTTNTASATGESNGITVKDFAIATVVVSPTPTSSPKVTPVPTATKKPAVKKGTPIFHSAAPSFPRTGFAPVKRANPAPWYLRAFSNVLSRDQK